MCLGCASVWQGRRACHPSAFGLPLSTIRYHKVLLVLCRNPFVVGLALTYFFIYVVRQGVTSWFVFYLIQVCASV